MSPERLSPQERAARRRRLDAVFGNVLPEQTRDDRTPDSEPADRGSVGDAWLQEQVPPHHGS